MDLKARTQTMKSTPPRFDLGLRPQGDQRLMDLFQRGGVGQPNYFHGVTSNCPAVEGVRQDLATAVGLLRHFARLNLIPVTGKWAAWCTTDPRSRKWTTSPFFHSLCSRTIEIWKLLQTEMLSSDVFDQSSDAGEAKIRWSWVNLGWVQTNPN